MLSYTYLVVGGINNMADPLNRSGQLKTKKFSVITNHLDKRNENTLLKLAEQIESDISLENPDLYINREFSALSFNQRILEKATDKSIPILERFKYLLIASSNLDEFFEIRVAGLKQQVQYNAQLESIDGLSPKQLLSEISSITHQISSDLYDIYNTQLIPDLAQEDIYFLEPTQWSPAIKAWLEEFFFQEIQPVVSPIGLDLARPFPRLVNKSLNFLVALSGDDAFGRNIKYAVTHAPRSVPRAIKIPKSLTNNSKCFVYLSSLMKAYNHHLFPGMTIEGCYAFRLTRNSDLFLREEEIDDLVSALKDELFERNYGDIVRLEIDNQCPQEMVNFLLKEHNLSKEDAYFCHGPVNLQRYMDVLDLIDRPNLRFKSFSPAAPASLKGEKNIFEALDKKDILLHHPFESFQTVVEFVRQAAADPEVLAIKQTVYRSPENSGIVNALVQAARAGKEVTAVIELRARFDEESNIHLADRLNKAGALVLYGVVGFKTHAKMTLVVRKHTSQVKSYVHLGTGNYHEHTAKSYTDLGLLTANEGIAKDIQKIFHQLTGLGKELPLDHIKHAPFTFKHQIFNFIQNAIEASIAQKDTTLIFKVNGLTDPSIIQALYRASQAGVKIKLFIRTLCSLKPGIRGVSDNITVTSIVGRFLEHHRIFYCNIDGKEEIYLASADLMERNLYHRIELMFPLLDKKCFNKIKEDIIENYLQDDKDAWTMQPDGTYIQAEQGTYSAQEKLLNKYIPKMKSKPSKS